MPRNSPFLRLIGGQSRGDSRWNLFLPPAPTALTTEAGNARVTLSWTAPTPMSQTPITDYVIQRSSDSGATWVTVSDGVGTDTSYAVTGLTNNVAYIFRVAAVTGIGQGAWSSASASSTPSSTPEAVLFSGGNSGFPNNYDGLFDLNGTANGRPRYTRVLPGPNSWTIDLIWAGSGSYWWNPAQSNQSNAWVVIARGQTTAWALNATDSAVPPTSGWTDTWNGSPTLSIVSEAGEPAAPTGLQVSPADGQLVLNWTAPTSIPGIDVTGYRIEYTPSGGTATVVNPTGTATSYTISGLTNGTSYSVRVAALNSVGPSQYTASVTKAAGTPTSLVFTSLNIGPATFTLNGASNGRPRYTTTYIGDTWVIEWTGSQWVSYRQPYGPPTYSPHHSNNNDTPIPPTTGWSNNQSGGPVTITYP